MSLRVGVDVGGTFTDFIAIEESTGRTIRHKRPSTPQQPAQAILDGIGELCGGSGLSVASVGHLAHGTTVATNALIQRRLGKVLLVTNEGFRDLLEIGRQTRPQVYDIHRDYPPPIVARDCRFEVPGRVRADGTVVRPLDEEAVRMLVPKLLAQDPDCVVVAFLHSFAHGAHERRAVEILREELGSGIQVISSASVYPEFREYERFTTAVLNGALLTVMDRYMERLISGVVAAGIGARPLISQSSGGLMSAEMARELPIRACLSGPAAGVSAVARWARIMGLRRVITLDIGGTSSDVALIRDFTPSELSVQEVGGMPIRMPAVDVNAVGAGGGTIAWIDRDGLLKVGPHSAGAHPGPACYGYGGTDATTTDANVLLGRLSQEFLLGGRMPVHLDAAQRAVEQLAAPLGLSVLDTARGILRLACATVVKALRRVSIERGLDPAGFTLFAFGGAGPQFAVDVAREIGISRIVVPLNPGLMCAEGLHFCTLSNDFVGTLFGALEDSAGPAIRNLRDSVKDRAEAWFESEAVPAGQRRYDWRAELRYRGQNFELSLPVTAERLDGTDIGALRRVFHTAHAQAYGFSSEEETVELVSIKLKARRHAEDAEPPLAPEGAPGKPVASREVIFVEAEPVTTAIYRRAELVRGQEIAGPAIIDQDDTTTLIYPGDRAAIDRWGNIVIDLGQEIR